MAGERIDVKPGQIWADNDWRCDGRQVQVVRIDGEYAVCDVIAGVGGNPPPRPRPPVRILLRRFKPTSTGYRFVGGPR